MRPKLPRTVHRLSYLLRGPFGELFNGQLLGRDTKLKITTEIQQKQQNILGIAVSVSCCLHRPRYVDTNYKLCLHGGPISSIPVLSKETRD